MKYQLLSILLVPIIITGCTATNIAHIGGKLKSERDIIVTTGSIEQPYRSIGFIQITRCGFYLFGFFDAYPARLSDIFTEDLTDQALRTGADAIINVRYYQLQYPLAWRLIAILSVVSPQYVTVTGELVEIIKPVD